VGERRGWRRALAIKLTKDTKKDMNVQGLTSREAQSISLNLLRDLLGGLGELGG